MAPRGRAATKRTAGSPTKASPKRSPKRARIDPRTRSVSMAIAGAKDQIPTVTRNMLKGMIGHSLGVAKDLRTPCQERVVEMIGEVMTAVETALQKQFEDAQSKANGFDDDKGKREAAMESAESNLAVLRVTATEKKNAVQAETQNCKNSEAELKKVEAEQKAGEEELGKATDGKARLEAMRNDAYQPLKDGVEDAAEQKKFLSQVVAVGTEFSFGESLMSATPLALAKPLSARADFDNLIMGQFEEELTKHIGEQEAVIADDEPRKERRAAAVESASVTRDVAKEQLAASKVALTEAEDAIKAGEAQLKEATQAVKQFLPELKEARAELEDAKNEVEEFRDGALASFVELRDFMENPPEPVAEEAEKERDPPDAKGESEPMTEDAKEE